jgi:hypothetical protein
MLKPEGQKPKRRLDHDAIPDDTLVTDLKKATIMGKRNPQMTLQRFQRADCMLVVLLNLPIQ